ncbi:hypothetical protein R1A27_20235 [Methylobacterium sp. NMS12]|uniref:hypothetical protein n=1 Tax=Methylobacterium sp. NMS12 TaxID=3079766 RepID=UPI003F8805B6
MKTDELRRPLPVWEAPMSFVIRLIAKAIEFICGGANGHPGNLFAADEQTSAPVDHTRRCDRDFDADYISTLRLLRDRIDRKFPDGHYAKLRAGMSSPHDRGEDRAQAVNTMSTAVAMALRDGATVQQAADIGAASIGI